MNEPVPVLLQPIPDSIQIQRTIVAEESKPVRGQLTDSAATLYTAPSGSIANRAILRCIVLCNTDSSARTATVYLVEDGGSTAADRAILYQEPLAAAGSAGCSARITFGEYGLTLEAGELVVGLASVTGKVTYRLEVVPRQ